MSYGKYTWVVVNIRVPCWVLIIRQYLGYPKTIVLTTTHFFKGSPRATQAYVGDESTSDANLREASDDFEADGNPTVSVRKNQLSIYFYDSPPRIFSPVIPSPLQHFTQLMRVVNNRRYKHKPKRSTGSLDEKPGRRGIVSYAECRKI